MERGTRQMTPEVSESRMSNLKRKSGSGIFQHFTVYIILHVFGSHAKRVLLVCTGYFDWQDDLSNLGDEKQFVAGLTDA
jgi:hypothetical protein